MSQIDLFKRSPPLNSENPFNGDLFDRRTIANRLTGYINRLKDGCVIGIDAPWGEGKTWFAQNWHAELKKTGHPTIYLDAFQNDFADDPFLVIASEIVVIAKEQKDKVATTAIVEKAKSVGKRIFPFGAKAVISIAGKMAIGSEGMEELQDALKGIPDDLGKAAEKYVERRLKDHELTAKSLENFKLALSDFAAKQTKPLVFMVDELDRCKPTFSVQFVERIKHFFDVPNLVFVLFVNRKQLEAAIQGMYGEKLDASSYLGKFIQFYLTLPKSTRNTGSTTDYNRRFLVALAKRHEYADHTEIINFIDELTLFASAWRFSFRDLERCFILFGLAQPVSALSGILAYVIALRVGRQDVYTLLTQNQGEGHTQAIALLRSINHAERDWVIEKMIALHVAHLHSFRDLEESVASHISELHSNFRIAPEKLLLAAFKKIDIQADN